MRPNEKRSRSALLWGCLFHAGLTVALIIVMSNWRLDLLDPAYAHKLWRLQARLAEEPGRPLLLLLGTSRGGVGFAPEALPALPKVNGREPLPFNFSVGGAGPVTQLLCLQRLVKEG